MERSISHESPEPSTADISTEEREVANEVLARINELLAEGHDLPEACKQALIDTGSDARTERIVMQILEDHGIAV